MKKIGVDIGKARIGIAMSDELGILASPYQTKQSIDLQEDVSYIASLVEEFKADVVVLGLPLMLDGSCGEMGEYAKNFSELLKVNTNAKVVLCDERLSSYEAEQILKQQKIKDWRKRKEILDQVAACIILQSYLDK